MVVVVVVAPVVILSGSLYSVLYSASARYSAGEIA